MKKLLFLLSLSIITNFLSAQDLRKSRSSSFFTYIFKLSEKQAQKIYLKGARGVEDSFFTDLIDSFPSDKKSMKALPVGHYLYVNSIRNELKFELTSVNNVNIKLLNNDRDLSIMVHDSSGKEFPQANVMLNHTRIRFDQKTNSFRLPETNRHGLLKIIYAGHINYFTIERDINYSKFKRTSNKILYITPLKYAVVPIKFVCLMPLDFVKSIAKQRFYGVFWYIKKPFSDIYYTLSNGSSQGFIRSIHCWFTKYEGSGTKGYMVFNKPKYLPGDTVYLKAFILDQKNRPVKDSLDLILQADNEKILAHLKPFRPGAYKYQFVIDKKLGLRLDRYYMLNLKYHGYNLISGSFNFEEYELKSTNYEFRSDKTNYKNGDQIALYCKSTDENDLNLPDARVDLCILSKNLKTYYKDRVFVPDTLWRHKQDLDPLGETKIMIPDSIFPPVNLDFSLEAQFLNSSNELHTKTLFLSRDYNPNQVVFSLKNDSICIDYKHCGKPAISKALLDASEVYENKPVILPFREKVNPFASDYYISTDSISELFELTPENSGVQCISNRTADSVWFTIINPRHVPLSYSIFKKNKLIILGNGSNSTFICKSKTPDNYFASVQFIWGGKVQSENYVIPFNKNQLNVRMYAPEVVYPGQKTKISIAVTDMLGNPVQDVDLTAFANTKKFNSSSIPNVPYLGKQYPNRIKYNAFNSNDEFDQLHGTKPLNWNRWNPLMKLDSIELYKFLYPKNGFYQSTFSRTNKDFAEVSPFLVDSGKLLPVNILYIDNQPVYFNITNTNQPYVFKMYEGWHKIIIRTINKEVTIKRVYLKAGFKTILSINPQIANNDEFSVVKRQLYYTRNERFIANSSLAAIRNNFRSDFALIRQGEKIELLNNYSYNWTPSLIAGPFNSNNFTFEDFGKFSTNLDFEQNFEYDFNPGIVKMRSNSPIISQKQHLDYKLPRENFNDSVFTYNDIKNYWQLLISKRQAIEPQYRNVGYSEPGKGLLKIHYQVENHKPAQEAKNYLLFSFKTKDFVRVYAGNEQLLHNLEPGYYKLIVLLLNNSYFKVDSILVKPNGTNYCRIVCSQPIAEDTYIRQINEIIQSRLLHYKNILIYDEQKAIEDLKQINKLADHTTTITYNNTSTISGQVTDAETKEPLPGVNVLVKGTNTGTITDLNGNFKLISPNTSQNIQFSYIGYMSEEIRTRQGANILVQMTPDVKKLEEVVVIGYGYSTKKDMTGSVCSIQTESLSGRMAGVSITSNSGDPGASIRIRGVSSLSSHHANSLYVVDGVPVSASEFNLRPDEIENVEVLKETAATAIYGTKASNGAVIITTKKKGSNTLVKNLLRNKDFLEGINQSNSLRTQFSDYAYWKPDLVTNKKGIASFDVTFPDDVTSWRTYILAMGKKTSGQTEGEIKSFKPVMSNLALPRFLIAGDKSNIIGKALNYTQDSIFINTNFEVDGISLYKKNGKILTSRIDTLFLNTPQKDSLAIKYSLTKDDGYSDGELRNIPVFPAGITETKGTFCTLDKDTTITFNFDKELGKVTVHAETNLVDVLLEEIQQIRNYGYLCNEQLSSKLKTMLWERKVYTLMKKKYPYQKDINKMITLLEERRNGDSLWGWWKTCETQWWITTHVAEALIQAREQGFIVNVNFSLIPSRLYQIFNKLAYRDKTRAVKLLKTIDPVPNYKMLIDSIKVNRTDTVGRYELMELKQFSGLPFNMDSLLHERKSTLFGNYYWGREVCSLFDDAISATLVAYRIIRRDSTHTELLPKIRNYFLERRGNMKWQNTWESCRILETILPDLINSHQVGNVPKIKLSGAIETIKTDYPFTCESKSGQSLTLSKQGTAPVYFSVCQQFFNNNPLSVQKDFIVKTYFANKDTTLKAGKPVILYANITVKKSSEYILIEIPIPAGCSYNDKKDDYRNESYREYFKEKVSIFCNRLSQGNYTFEINLLPRYNGTYYLNPAKAELMYFPVFYGREKMKQVDIR